MRSLRALVLALLSFPAACGSAPSEPARAPSAAPTAATANPSPRAANDAEPAATLAPNSSSSQAPLPTDAMKQADAIYRDQLATQGRDDRFSTDRQAAALERAILLYRQFLDRAGDDPRYADAVKRSRERIQDAEEGLTFLRGAP